MAKGTSFLLFKRAMGIFSTKFPIMALIAQISDKLNFTFGESAQQRILRSFGMDKMAG
jgi:hypothetical protein